MDSFALWVLVVLYFITNIVYILDIYATYRRSRELTMAFFCKAMYLLVEAIVPLIYVAAYTMFGKTYVLMVRVDFSSEGTTGLMIYWLLTVIGYVALHLGVSAKFRLKVDDKVLRAQPVRTYYNSFALTAAISLVIGLICFFLWTQAYGGIAEFIKVADKVRSGIGSVNNTIAFFKQPAGLCLVASYAFFTLWCAKWKRWLMLVPLAISVYFSVLFLLATDGRMFAGFYFLTLVIIYIRSWSAQQHKLSGSRMLLLALCLVGMVILMMEMNDITAFIRTGKWPKKLIKEESMLDTFIKEFMFIIRSGQHAVMNSDKIGVRFFEDLLAGIFAWLPTSLKPFKTELLWAINTQFLNPFGNGTIPFDIITQGYYDLRLVGVFLFPFCFGLLVRWADEKCDNSPYGIFLFAALFYRMSRAIPYGEMYDFVLGIFPLSVFCVIYWVMKLFLTQNQGGKRNLT